VKPRTSTIPGSSGTPNSAPAKGPPTSRRIKYALLSLACVALSGLATYGGFEIFSPIRVPPAMRGTWVVVEGKGLDGATLEFSANGRMIGTVPAGGEGVTTIEGKVEVDGNRFRVRTDGNGPRLATEPEDILELTDRRFVVQDSQGEVLIMERSLPTSPATPRGAR